MRLTRKLFHDLAIWMVGFGLSIGVLFPFFVLMLGVPRDTALQPVFFAACLAAGALAGVMNYALARWVVGQRLRTLAGGMRHVKENLQALTFSNDLSRCSPESCSVPDDSDDEIGESARAFNQLVGSLATSMRTQAAIRSFSSMLASQLEIEGLAASALRRFVEAAHADGGVVLYESGGELKVAASLGLRDPEKVAASDHVRLAARSGEPQVVSIPEDVRVEGVLTDFRPSQVLVHPVTCKGALLGVVVLAAARAFEPEQRALIDLFLQGLGLALNNALAHDRLQRLAALDPLTGVYNRRFGLGRLHEEFGRAVRASAPLGLLMLDIDHFKDVNDTHGHLVGDHLLKSVCAAIRSALREGDILLRYGGEEFLAVLPAASSDNLKLIGERIRRLVEESPLPVGETSIRATLSIGGAAYPDQDVDREDALIQMADEALYRAKHDGRNRVEITW